MPGKAYNPKGFEPGVNERFDAPPPEAMEAYRKAFMAAREKRPAFTYEESQEYRLRGESHILGHYVYEQMFNIYYGIEDKLIEGAWDTHLHIYPDYVPRCIDMIELAIDASKVGYRAICCKDHFFNNTNGAWAAQWVAEDLVRRGELEHSCEVLGTNVLAWSFHPDQINLIRKYPNLGGVFFPTFTGRTTVCPELPILDDKGKLMPEVKECIRRMADYKICVFTGHRNYEEHLAMVQYAHEVGAHILLTHSGGMHFGPGYSTCGTIEQAKELIKLGAYIEVSLHWFVGASAIWPISIPTSLTDWLKEMASPEHIVMSTDLGQPSVLHPIEGYRVAIRLLLHAGFSKEDLKIMFQKNAVEALRLDD